MIRASKEWFAAQTIKIKRLTIWLSFFIACFTIWGSLKIAGVEGIDFVIGCSSFATMSKETKDSLDAEKQHSHWKWMRQKQINDSLKEQIRIINGD